MTQNFCTPTLHGWLILDKPLGLTSTQALGRSRRVLGGKKVGHGGTLDPLATGVLPLAFGEATKLIPYVVNGDKEYEFTIRWGEARTTDDAEGDIVSTSDVRPTEDQIRKALPVFTGVLSQKPPVFSAIKVHGDRAYDLARAGEAVELASREVWIRSLTLQGSPEQNTAVFKVSCGKGMYVRSLARDLAVYLGTVGYVCALRRTKVGPFLVENAVSLDDLERSASENCASSHLLPLKTALGSHPTLSLSQNEAFLLQRGQGLLIRPQNITLLNIGPFLAEYNGVPIAMVEAIAGEFRVLRGFHF